MRIEDLLAALSLEQKVGQLFMVGFEGQRPDRELLDFIVDHALGGVIYFARNLQSAAQVVQLTNSLQEAAASESLPLLISTDQEGGIVARFTERQGFAVPPGAMAYGALKDGESAQNAARIAARETARQLRCVGVNMNLAPVVDVNNNPDNPVIGVRSCGADPERVAELGAAQVAGYQQDLAESGVLATAKHFPGHGDTTVDSHYDLPRIDHTLKRLQLVELVPFRAAIARGVGAVMTAHIVFSALESGGLPATLSPAVLSGLLRRDLGFEGLIVTDCMEMAAIATRYSPAEAAIRAVEAGADMVLYSHTRSVQVEALEGVVKAVRSGRIPLERVDASVARVLQAKKALGLLDRGGTVRTPLSRRWVPGLEVGTDAQYRLFREHAGRAVTVLDPGEPRLPRSGRIQVVVLQGAGRLEVENQRGTFSDLGRRLRQHCDVTELVVTSADNGADQADILEQVDPEAEIVLVATHDAWRSPEERTLLQRLLEVDRPVLHVSLRGPRDLALSEGRACRLCVYDTTPASLNGLIDVLAGRRVPEGRLPVRLR